MSSDGCQEATLRDELDRYKERCLPTIERYREMIRAKRQIEGAERVLVQEWSRISKIMIERVQEVKRELQKMFEGVGVKGVEYPTK